MNYSNVKGSNKFYDEKHNNIAYIFPAKTPISVGSSVNFEKQTKITLSELPYVPP